MNRLRVYPKYTFEIICCFPLLAFTLLFNVAPIGQVFYLSVQQKSSPFVTLAHFQRLWQEPEFIQAVFYTIIIALGSVTVEIVVGLGLALLLARSSKLTKICRPLFMLPLAIPTVVVAVMMSFLFSTSGWLNRILTDVGLISQPILWMDGGLKSLLMIIFADSWKVTPLVMLILIAGLQQIDQNLYDAARVDGATPWQMFRSITLPLLMPSITSAVIIRGIDAFRIFALVLILMGQSFKVIGTYAYLEYAEYHNTSLSAASAVVLFGLILIAIFIYLKSIGHKGLSPTS